MRRAQLFEFNDLPQSPRALRESITETLGTGLRWCHALEGVGVAFAEFCARAGCHSVLDVCSGSGDAVSTLIDALERQRLAVPRFALSDLHPNLAAWQRVQARHAGRVEVIPEPVDALAVAAHHDRPARTIINALHHFPPALAARLLADCAAKRRALFVVEAFPRSLWRVAPILPALLAAGAVNPLIAPRARWQKALLTYASPAVLMAGLWDAAVSALRIHEENELRDMVAGLDGYDWEYRQAPFFAGGRAVVFFGIPR